MNQVIKICTDAHDIDDDLGHIFSIGRLDLMTKYKVVDNTLCIYRDFQTRDRKDLEKIPFPTQTDFIYLINFIKSWQSTAQYPESPDIDGSVNKGIDMSVYHYGSCVEDINYFQKEIQLDIYQIGIIVKPYWVEYHK